MTTNPGDLLAEAARLRLLGIVGHLGEREPLACPDCVGAFTVRASLGNGVDVEAEIHDNPCPRQHDKEPSR